jgi:beta-1,4-galactosyltransferase 4
VTFSWAFFFQAGDGDFNRGIMFNIGYTMAQNLSNNYWDCLIFHDTDLLPENDKNSYTCADQPRHMSVGKKLKVFPLKIPNTSAEAGNITFILTSN